MLVPLESELPGGHVLPLPTEIAVPPNWESAAAAPHLQKMASVLKLKDCSLAAKSGALVIRTCVCSLMRGAALTCVCVQWRPRWEVM
jgi:hypothetical protein